MEIKTTVNASRPFEDVCRDNARSSRHQQGGAPVIFRYGGEELTTWGKEHISELACAYVEKHHWKVTDPEEAAFLKEEDFHYSFAPNAFEVTLRAKRNIDPDFLCIAVRAAKFIQAELKKPETELEAVWEKSFKKAGAESGQYFQIAAVLKAPWICGDELHDIVSRQTKECGLSRPSPANAP